MHPSIFWDKHQQLYNVLFEQSLTARTDNNPLSTEYSEAQLYAAIQR